MVVAYTYDNNGNGILNLLSRGYSVADTASNLLRFVFGSDTGGSTAGLHSITVTDNGVLDFSHYGLPPASFLSLLGNADGTPYQIDLALNSSAIVANLDLLDQLASHGHIASIMDGAYFVDLTGIQAYGHPNIVNKLQADGIGVDITPTDWVWSGNSAEGPGGDGSASWSDAGNWAGGVVPVIASGDTVTLSPTYFNPGQIVSDVVDLSGALINQGSITLASADAYTSKALSSALSACSSLLMATPS